MLTQKQIDEARKKALTYFEKAGMRLIYSPLKILIKNKIRSFIYV